MASSIQSTQLDFINIKNKLKTYLAQQPEFTDYNFEASGLSNILDVLAYNTHFNGLIANFALNESFLTTSQLRSSVVSHAESLGYTPRSRTPAIGYVNIQVTNTSSGRSSTVTLPAYTKFTGSVDGVAYTFQTTSPYVAADNGSGVYRFADASGSFSIPIFEGTFKTKTFYVGETSERQLYIIPDINMCTRSVVVNVYDTPTSDNFITYTSINEASGITSDSTYYNIHESPNGQYEVHFSDGLTTGRAPVAGNKIIITYMSSNGPDANGSRAFIPNSTIPMDSLNLTLAVTTVSGSNGGSNKESIESIRANAPIAFAGQQRMVTALDYKSRIITTYSGVDDCAAWGGETNVPIEYGKVLVSIKFNDGINAENQTNIKNSIVADLTDNLAMMSIDTKFIDPIYTYIGCKVDFNYNPDLSATSVSITQTQVLSAIEQYFLDNLNVFNGVFRRSNILTIIDELSLAILNSKMDVTIQRRFTPDVANLLNYELYFPVSLSSPNTQYSIITSGNFTYNNKVCSIINKLGSTKLQIIDNASVVVVDNIGEYTPATGRITLVGFQPQNVISSTELKINAIPSNQGTVKSDKNFILVYDPSSSYALGTIEHQN